MMDEFNAILRDLERRLAEISTRLTGADSEIKAELAIIRADIERLRELTPYYVTQHEFRPVKSIVYGMVSLALSSVFLGVLALVLNKGGM